MHPMCFEGSWTLCGAPVPIEERQFMSEDWSDFGSDVKQEARSMQRGPRCGMGVLLDQSEPQARETLQRVLEDRGNSSAAITRALRNRLGEDAPSQFTVNNHRRGNCRCGRVTR